MVKWSKTAEELLDIYIENHLGNSNDNEADPLEVREDLKRHIEEDVIKAGRDYVIESDVNPLFSEPELQKLDFENRFDRYTERKTKKPFFTFTSRFSLFFFAIVMPVLSFAVELITDISKIYIDPMPTLFDAFLVVSVPVVNAIILYQVYWRKNYKKLSLYSRLNGFVFGVALFYSLVYLPVAPFAVIAIIFAGFGFLPLTPLTSLIVALTFQHKLRKIAKENNIKRAGLWQGFLVYLIVMTISTFINGFTYIGLATANSKSKETAQLGVTMLRHFGNKSIMIEECSRSFNRSVDKNIYKLIYILTPGESPSREEAKKIFYLVTGEVFDSTDVEEYNNSWNPILSRRRISEDGWDENVGKSIIGRRFKTLLMVNSRIDQSLDANGGVAYTEWIMTFQNNSTFRQREARAVIQLPKGSVVSRVSLWVDGEEREAAFASRSKAKEAYQRVVSRKRDPLLVTTDGLDRLMVQCFPVEPKGQMKIKLGFSSPVKIVTPETGILSLPVFMEQNFTIRKDVNYSFWSESKMPIAFNQDIPLKEEKLGKKGFAVRGDIPSSKLSYGLYLTAKRNPDIIGAWTKDKKADNFVIQTIEKRLKKSPAKVNIVLDTSANMAPYKKQLFEALEAYSANRTINLFPADSASLETVNSKNNIRFIGGYDNIPALDAAWEDAANDDNSIILWIHGPQPYQFEPISSLTQKWERRSNSPMLYDFQLVPGENPITKAFEKIRQYKTLYFTGNIKNDLNLLFNPKQDYFWQRKSSLQEPDNINAYKETSSHLTRIWIAQKINEMLYEGKQRKEAVDLAIKYQLVTPVSGAVVLENQKQYEEAKLDPANRESVPTIPEPETYLLIIITLILISAYIYYSRQQKKCLSS